MIKTINHTPSIYSKESRDYQLISRLFDAVFNYSKASLDGIENLPLSKNSDDRFLDLVAKTLGFESKHNYNTENLFALCSSFKKIMFHKGSLEAIEDCIKMLLKAQNIDKKYIVDMKDKTLLIYIPKELKDVVLLEDMMSYILPAGIVYEIYARDIGQNEIGTEVSFESVITYIEGSSSELSRVDSYINASLVVGEPSEISADSGKTFIDGQ